MINWVQDSGHSMCTSFLFSFLDSHANILKRTQTEPVPVEL